jgi:hypothetical protein
MTKFLKTFLICVILLTLTACFQVDTTLEVKTDGSGVIEETFLMKKDFLDQMKIMVEGMAKDMGQALPESENHGKTQKGAEAQNKTKEFDIFDEAKLKEGAKEMGEGVTYVEGSKVVVGGYEGYKAIYAFKDINKVRINQNPGEKVPGGPQQGNADAKGAKEYLTFTFTKGKPAELIIKSPAKGFDKKSGDSSEGVKPSQDNANASEEMLSQMKGLFQGMKFALAVVVDGDILETNATHREGSKITLLELDFGKLIENPEKFKKFSESKPKTMEEAKLLMQDLPGIKVDLNNEIKIIFDQRKI